MNEYLVGMSDYGQDGILMESWIRRALAESAQSALDAVVDDLESEREESMRGYGARENARICVATVHGLDGKMLAQSEAIEIPGQDGPAT